MRHALEESQGGSDLAGATSLAHRTDTFQNGEKQHIELAIADLAVPRAGPRLVFHNMADQVLSFTGWDDGLEVWQGGGV